MGATPEHIDDQAELHSLARSMRLRTYSVPFILGALVALLFLAVERWTNTTLALLVVVAVTVLWFLPIYRAGPVTETYTTNKSRSRVSEEFTSECPPILALRYHHADDVSHRSSDGQTSIEYTDGSDTMRFDVEPTDAGGIDGTIRKNGEWYGSYTVSIEETAGTTAIEIEYDPARRFTLKRLSLLLAVASLNREMMRVQGYEPDSTGSIGI